MSEDLWALPVASQGYLISSYTSHIEWLFHLHLYWRRALTNKNPIKQKSIELDSENHVLAQVHINQPL